MHQETIEKLKKDYSQMKIKGNSSVIKYIFKFNSVNVNIYFDEFDKNIPNLSMILIKGDNYYYSSLNILRPEINVQYLEKIPLDILRYLLNNNKLDEFFIKVENFILENDCYITSYKKDPIFKNTMKYTVTNKVRKDLPFLQGCRHAKMTDSTYYRLQNTFGIEQNVLDKIRDKNLTLVRTSDINRRKNLIFVLENVGLSLNY